MSTSDLSDLRLQRRLERKSNDGASPVEKLHLSAQPLRYLSLAFDHTVFVEYCGHSVRVPEPEAFVLLKLLVIPRRKNDAKVAKDIQTVQDLGEFLLGGADVFLD